MNCSKIKNLVINQLKGELGKRILLQIIGKTVGLKAWIIKFIFDNLWDKVAVPIVNLGIRKGRVIVHKGKQKVVVQRMKNADTRDDFYDALNDL